MANDCSSLSDEKSQLYTDPLKPKGLSADTSAAYGLMAFVGDNRQMKLVFSGKVPKAKFMSLQVYRGRLQRHKNVGDALLDFQIDASSGQNPFREHYPNLEGEFRIEITPVQQAGSNGSWHKPVTCHPGEDRAIISTSYRVCQPDCEYTLSELPRIQAVDVYTGHPMHCPVYSQFIWYLEIPEVLANVIVAERDKVAFMTKASSAGTNDAIPAYTTPSPDLSVRVAVTRECFGILSCCASH